MKRGKRKLSERKKRIQSLKKKYRKDKIERARLKESTNSKRRLIAAIKISTYCGLTLATFFSAYSLIFYFGDWVRLIIAFFLGLFSGSLIAPEIEPGVFKQAWLFQLICGILAGSCFYLVMLDSSLISYLFSITIGGLLGITTSIWAKYVPLHF